MKSFVDALKLHPELYERYRKSHGEKVAKLREHPDYQKLRSEFSLDDKALEQSLPEIRHWILEKENCSECPGLSNCPNMYAGHFSKPKIDNGQLRFQWEPCSLQVKSVTEERQKRNLRSHVIPLESLKVSFADLEMDEGNAKAIQAAVLFCKQFSQGRRNGLYFYGQFGVGKTHLMGAVAARLAELGHSVYFVHVPAFFREMKQSLSDQTFGQKVAELEAVDCLIFDDIGSESLTPWLRDEVLAPILQYRTQNGKPTLYTSNLSYDQLEEHLSETSRGDIDLLKSLRIMERIRSYTDVYYLEGKNRRRC